MSGAGCNRDLNAVVDEESEEGMEGRFENNPTMWLIKKIYQSDRR
jgi:hypothetical protein